MLQLSPCQYGLTAVHIVCKKGNLNILRKLLSTDKQQNVYCSVKGRPALPTDCEVVLSARAKEVIVTCSFVMSDTTIYMYTVHTTKGWYPVMFAVKEGHAELLKEFFHDTNYAITTKVCHCNNYMC